MTTATSKASHIEASVENLVERHLNHHSEKIYSERDGIWSSLPTQLLTHVVQDGVVIRCSEIREKLDKICEYLGNVCFIHDWLTNEYEEEDDMKEVRNLDEDTRRAFREAVYRKGCENRRLADEIISTIPKSVFKILNFNKDFNFDAYHMNIEL